MSTSPEKTRIAVLGGGFGSLSAVFALTSEPGWEERYQITVYQEGWRLGGKAASGRDVAEQSRSASRGSHVWFGFYENALGMMRRIYQELGRAPGTPMATFREAFAAGSALHLASEIEGRAPVWPLALPENGEVPGEGGPIPTIWGYVGMILGWVLESLPQLHRERGSYQALIASWEAGTREILVNLITRARKRGIACYGDEAIDPDTISDAMILRASAICATIEASLEDDATRRAWISPLLLIAEECVVGLLRDREQVTIPYFLGPLRLGLGLIRGILGDRLYAPGRSYEVIQGEEFREWLGRHGADDDLLQHPLVGELYAAFFAYTDGESLRPAIAAGTMLQVVLRLFFTYRGALYYVPRAGMGEIVFAPLYLLLRRRGVRFKFFHRVKALHVAEGEELIDGISIGRQVALKRRRSPYDPLIAVKGLSCWPSAPRWEQIVLGDQPEVQALDFESPDAPEVDAIRLRRGRDFDLVICGIPPDALAPISRRLTRRSERWAGMLDNLKTAAVGGIKLWLHPSWKELTGDPSPALAGSNFPAPFSRWTNTSATISAERWTGNHWPGSSISLEASIPEAVLSLADGSPGSLERAAEGWIRLQARRWLQSHTRRLWPEGVTGSSNCLDWNLLVDAKRRMGEERLDGQHLWTAPQRGRFVLSLPGGDRHRLAPGDSGFGNLALAGDWTDTGLNLGCIEAAVISGIQAARAISGAALPILGELERPARPASASAAAASAG